MSLLAKSDRLKYIHRRPPLFWAKWAKLKRYECVISTQLGQDDLQKRSLLADSVKHSVGKSSETDKKAFGRKSISRLQSIKNIEGLKSCYGRPC